MKRFSLRSARSRTRLIATGAVACAMAGTMALSASGTAGAAGAATPGVTATSVTLGATEPLTGINPSGRRKRGVLTDEKTGAVSESA